MNSDTRIVLSVVCFIFAFALAGVGILMRKFDFSGMLNHPWKKADGLYIRKGLRLKKVAEDTPESRIRYSKRLGNFFILLSILWFFVTSVFIWN